MSTPDPAAPATTTPASATGDAASGSGRDPAGAGPAAPQVAQAAGGKARVMTGLTLFAGRRYLCGPAFTCACAPGDNLAVQAAVYQAPPGSVIVCHGGGTTTAGLFGGLVAADAAHHGLAGLVIEGPGGRNRSWRASPRASASPTSTASTSPRTCCPQRSKPAAPSLPVGCPSPGQFVIKALLSLQQHQCLDHEWR